MSPSNPAVCVETNWILDVVLGRDRGSMRMLDLMQSGDLTIYVPSFCISESIKSVETTREAWRELSSSLETQQQQLRVARELRFDLASVQAIRDGFAEMRDRLEDRLWTTLERIGEYAGFVEIDRRSINRVRAFRATLNLSPGDAMVLSAALDVAQAGLSRNFMSKNTRDFGTADLRALFEENQIAYHPNPAAFLRTIRDEA